MTCFRDKNQLAILYTVIDDFSDLMVITAIFRSKNYQRWDVYLP
tara:strand:- start:1535 stop:1666 length:132 start_codon:yes stop_codon:yes gene_type:complete